LNFPINIEEKIGFDKVRGLLKAYTKSNLGKQALEKISFSTQIKSIQKSIHQIVEFSELKQNGFLPEIFEDLEYIQTLISNIEKEGFILYEDELNILRNALVCFQNNFDFIDNNSALIPTFLQDYDSVLSIKAAINRIDAIIDKEGKVKPNASAELLRISNDIKQKEKDVRRLLVSKFELAKKNGWAGDTEITIRNERLVIPIIAEFKKKVNGFVHDDSQSGKFLYIEPIECFEENNLLKELHLAYQKEIEKILRSLTHEISFYKQSIWQHIKYSVFIDTTNAKQILSSTLKGIKPQIVNHPQEIRLLNAKHPLLFIQLQKDNKKLVPLNFELKDTNYLILISGPNAGGKSITLKTIALLQYMFQCGLPVPMDMDSKMTVFNQIFIDIGDNQSIENNLSSYSSHLHNMNYFLENIDNKTLYLIDELGNGTDPLIGTSIAQAILENLLSKKGLGIVTTHFGELKAWASQTNGVCNARMLYDMQNLEPRYEFEIGKQGSSFALEVASKVGLKQEIIERVKKISKQKDAIDLDELIAENERNKQILSENKQKIAEKELVLEKMISEYQTLKEALKENKVAILNEAKAKAFQLLTESNQKIEQTIKEIKVNQAEKAKTKELRKKLSEHKEVIKPVVILSSAAKKDQNSLEIKIGSIVKQFGSQTKGEVISIKGKNAQVLFGEIKMTLPLENLESSNQPMIKRQQSNNFTNHIVEKQKQFYPDLDLRGVRGEEALVLLDDFINDGNLLNIKNLKIIHGRGYGILKKIIKEFLHKNKFVAHFEHESEQMGGDGVTLITMT